MRNIMQTIVVAAAVVTLPSGLIPATQPEPQQPAPVIDTVSSRAAKTVEGSPAAHDAWDPSTALGMTRPPKRVDYWIERFTGDQRKSFATYLARMDSFAPLIESKLDERGMPHDLLYLAMIESGFNPLAQSPAKAKGLWQFVEATAERYGLTVTGKVDERVDPEKSTEAALTYLSDLYERFGSWYLAAAAYNSGENRVARVMRTVTGSERGTDADFDAIASHLPKETREYVPRIVAAARIAEQPEKYGFTGGKS
ncbi:MAG TPA: lytic transglycosylase domain-containing protein [Thermoanaerobaculia bacterium]|nr:lytic transglycosylase domain-containing protein [Thermoanaerobaculia bacterium]